MKNNGQVAAAPYLNKRQKRLLLNCQQNLLNHPNNYYNQFSKEDKDFTGAINNHNSLSYDEDY